MTFIIISASLTEHTDLPRFVQCLADAASPLLAHQSREDAALGANYPASFALSGTT